MGREILNIRLAGLSLLPASARKPRLLEAAVRRAFSREKSKKSGEVNIIFVSGKDMRAMNLEFLGHDYDTDVIAFEHPPAPDIPAAETPIGDIYISSTMAARQARELGHAVLREVLTLAVHGALHLLGHDDASPRAKARMFRRQDEILERLKA